MFLSMVRVRALAGIAFVVFFFLYSCQSKAWFLFFVFSCAFEVSEAFIDIWRERRGRGTSAFVRRCVV